VNRNFNPKNLRAIPELKRGCLKSMRQPHF
jgi:hypothetical protein